MGGLIKRREILANLPLIWREWGWRGLLAAAFCELGLCKTWLAGLQKAGCFR
jgi:hypothetical protein